jgi:hypothetical protein
MIFNIFLKIERALVPGSRKHFSLVPLQTSSALPCHITSMNRTASTPWTARHGFRRQVICYCSNGGEPQRQQERKGGSSAAAAAEEQDVGGRQWQHRAGRSGVPDLYGPPPASGISGLIPSLLFLIAYI